MLTLNILQSVFISFTYLFNYSASSLIARACEVYSPIPDVLTILMILTLLLAYPVLYLNFVYSLLILPIVFTGLFLFAPALILLIYQSPL